MIGHVSMIEKNDKNTYNMSILFVSVILLGFLSPLVLLSDVRGDFFTPSALLAWLIVMYASVRLSQFAARGRKYLFDLTFWLFVYVWMGVASLLQVVAGEYPWPGQYSDGTMIFALVIILGGLIFFDLGCHQASKSSLLSGSPWPNVLLRKISIERNFVFCIFSLLVSGLVMYLIDFTPWSLISRAEMANLLATGAESKDVVLIRSVLVTMPSFVSLIMLILTRHEWRRLWYFWPIALFIFILNIITSNPIVSPRFWSGTVALSILFSIFYFNRPRKTFFLSLGLVFSLLFLFPYLDTFRRTIDVNLATLERVDAAEPILRKGDYDAFQQVLNSVNYVNVEGLSFGRQAMGTVLFWVPRSRWEAKPFGTGTTVAVSSGYSFTNLSAPLWAEFYVDFGVLGVFLGFYLYGYIIRRIQNHFYAVRMQAATLGVAVFYVLSAFQIYLLRGELMGTFSQMVAILFFMFLVSSPEKRVSASGMNRAGAGVEYEGCQEDAMGRAASL